MVDGGWWMVDGVIPCLTRNPDLIREILNQVQNDGESSSQMTLFSLITNHNYLACLKNSPITISSLQLTSLILVIFIHKIKT
jgi:hypothetical protein